jgi:hypothetical protein
MTSLDSSIIVGIATFILTVGTSALFGGLKLGKMENEIDNLKANAVKWDQMALDVSNMKSDLAEIKGMFRLTLKD